MKNSGKKLIFHLKSWTFTENPCLILRKTRFFFTGSAAAVKNVKIEQFSFKIHWFFQKKPGNLATLRFSGIFDFAVCVWVLLYILLYV